MICKPISSPLSLPPKQRQINLLPCCHKICRHVNIKKAPRCSDAHQLFLLHYTHNNYTARLAILNLVQSLPESLSGRDSRTYYLKLLKEQEIENQILEKRKLKKTVCPNLVTQSFHKLI